jgi:hypothetical protein
MAEAIPWVTGLYEERLLTLLAVVWLNSAVL